jgi:site-specific recombinase XerD
VIEEFFEFSFTINRLREGPLADHMDAFASLLAGQGYSQAWARVQIRVVGEFNRWLRGKRIELPQVDENAVTRFLAYRERAKPLPPGRAFALTRLLRMLRDKGVLAEPQPPAPTPTEAAVAAFGDFLRQERGLAQSTLANMLPFVEEFLSAWSPTGRFRFSSLTARDVTQFIQRRATELGAGRAKLLVTALRSFLRYLRYQGEIQTDLAACVPSVPTYSLSSLPKYLPAGSIERVLQHADRSTPRGRQERAMLLLLARLGLRSAELMALTLEDIDWDAGQITIRGKGDRWAGLPLPSDVGEAIADYLCQDRPQCGTRKLFVTRNAPLTGLRSRTPIQRAVQRALDQAGITSARGGAHLFRHTLATDMLRRGASLNEIGEVLRHRDPNTTRIYAKVDLVALQKLALPWPGGAR